jgi:hypothetical protein
MAGLTATYQQRTGDVFSRAYLVEDHKVIRGCKHKHRQQTTGGQYRNSGYFAQRCADKMLRAELRARAAR